jgi:hypothetical protein
MITTIGQLFKIEYGQKEFENKEPLEEDAGGNILISSKGDDNGVLDFFVLITTIKPLLLPFQELAQSVKRLFKMKIAP